MRELDGGAELRAEALEAMDRWLRGNLDLVGGCFQLYLHNGLWPRSGELASLLGAADVSRRWQSAPLGLTAPSSDQALVPLIRALAPLPPARPLLDDAIDVLQVAVRASLERFDGRLYLDSDEVCCELEMTSERLSLVSRLLWAEPGLGGIRVGDERWSWQVDDELLRYRSANTLERYLAEQAWALWPDGPVSPIMRSAVRNRGAGSNRLLPSPPRFSAA